MAYYQGDYYQGDYYQGDPFWGGIWSAVKGVGGALLGVGRRKSAQQAMTLGSRQALVRSTPSIVGGVLGGAAAKWWFGKSEAAARAQDPHGRLPPGFIPPQMLQRIQKAPGIRGAIERFLPGGETGYLVRRRQRMNVANPKALRRSLRRVAGFGKLASRARRDIGRAATAVGVNRGRGGAVARHHARIRAKA